MLTYFQRSKLCTNPTAKQLFSLMEEKQSNLAVAADLTDSHSLLRLADAIGPEICLLKTHIDILSDFTPECIRALQIIAQKHRFLLFEDRKFADIGNTVMQQYAGGIYQIANWAHIINAHIIPGPGIITGLKTVGLPKQRGLLLLAEMSSSGTLACGAYTEQAIQMAKEAPDFVIGFISLRALSVDPRWIYMTPGVQLSTTEEAFGQQYRSPASVIEAGSDVIIVGRGIYGESDPQAQAKRYRITGWEAHEQRTHR